MVPSDFGELRAPTATSCQCGQIYQAVTETSQPALGLTSGQRKIAAAGKNT
jgi:hypothetical protein